MFVAFDDDGDHEDEDYDESDAERCPECGATLSEEHAIDCALQDDEEDDGDGL